MSKSDEATQSNVMEIILESILTGIPYVNGNIEPGDLFRGGGIGVAGDGLVLVAERFTAVIKVDVYSHRDNEGQKSARKVRRSR
jgi:hypothetical protein